MKTRNKRLILGAVLLSGGLLYSSAVIANGLGSEAIYGGTLSTLHIAAGGTHINTEETLYIGGGNYEINGTWEVYSKYVVIDPSAIITGTGSIQLYNPSVAGATASRTFIDGNTNANSIEVDIVLNNASGMELFDKQFPADLTAGTDFTNSASSSVYVGKDLNLAVDGADVWLDADGVGDLAFDNNAVVSNFSVNRMVITNNSIISHVTRDAGSSGFFFPIGKADGDYTPADIIGTDEYHISVQDYSASSSIESEPTEGMDRTWHLFGGTASSVSLHHNSPSTDGTSYNDALAFITRYEGTANWSTGIAEQVTVGVHTNTSAIGSGIPASGLSDGSYLTKTSDASTPLPVQLLSFNAYKKGETAFLVWATASERNNKGFDIERSLDGQSWSKIGFVKSLAGGNSSNTADYNFTDFNPANGQNMYRLKQVNIDGSYEYSDIKIQTFGNDQILIYPNPATSTITIDFPIGNYQIAISNIAGQQVLKKEVFNQAELELDIRSLSAGVYQVQIYADSNLLQSHKLLKQ